MKREEGYVLASVIANTIDVMALSGRPVAQILERAGVTREALSPPGGRLPIATAERLLRAALDVTQDPQLMLKLSQISMPNGFGLVGYLVQACPTLQDIADSMVRFVPLLTNAGRPQIRYEPGRIIWAAEIDHEEPEVVRQAVEYAVGGGYRFLLLLDARRSDLMHEIRFRHAAPTNPAQLAVYHDIFSCPVRFGADVDGFVLKPNAMATRMRLPDAALRNL